MPKNTPGPGRPQEIEKPGRVVCILPAKAIRWLKRQPDGQSATIRALVEQAMKK